MPPLTQKKYWRTLAERTGAAEVEQWLRAEFPNVLDEASSEIGRRDFIRLMGASAALAGFGACTKQPLEKIVPYVKQPEQIVSGKPLHFATACTFGGYAQGILVRSNEGRPTKIEGNADHPASLGGTSIWGQADLLDLYDPDRSQNVLKNGQVNTWDGFLREMQRLLSETNAGAGLRILTQTVTSPTLTRQLQAVLARFPQAHLHQWDPTAGTRSGSEDLIYNVADAAVIVALESDFLYAHPAALRYGRDFASTRRMGDSPDAKMSRLYVAEPTPTITGSNADHRLPAAARDIATIADALLAEISGASKRIDLAAPLARWVSAAAADLRENQGDSVVLAGETQPAPVHAIVAQINDALGNNGTTISPRPPVAPWQTSDPTSSLRSLVSDIESGSVNLLVILGGNPIYDAPTDLNFAGALAKVGTVAHHHLFVNETSRQSTWHLPAAHFLEAWSDALAFDGSATIIQPLIEPLYDGWTAHQIVDALLQPQGGRSAFDIIHASWMPNPGSEEKWQQAVQRGVAREPRSAGPDSAEAQNGGETPPNIPIPPTEKSPSGSLELLFRLDPNVLDGRYANNAWIQELPRPFSKLTWDNAAIVSPALAGRLNLQNGDMVELAFQKRTLRAPVWIQPGQALNSVTLHLGYGRTDAGRVGNNVGVNAYALRTTSALWFGDGLEIRKTAQQSHEFATTQQHHSMEGRHIFRAGTLAQFQTDPDFARKEGEEPKPDETLYHPDEFKKPGYAWGMVIDLGTCIGCNTCTIACQAENNIPVVGKYQVKRGPGDALDPRRQLLRRKHRGAGDQSSAGSVHALRTRAVRTRLSRRRDRA